MARVSTGLDDDAALAATLVADAGRLARRMRAAGVDVDTKTSVSDVVTAADHAAEAHVVARLREARPGDGILGEEGASTPGTTGRRWVVDPVDGTYNFVADLPWWCSALALTEGDELVLGAVYDPHADAVHLGGPDLASTRAGAPMAPLRDVGLAQTCVATYLHPPLLDTEVGAAWRRAVGGAATIRMLGSMSRDQMAVARGELGAVVQHSVLPWDELPGAAVIRGVGGVTRHVEAAGQDWYVAGAPSAVAGICAALGNG